MTTPYFSFLSKEKNLVEFARLAFNFLPEPDLSLRLATRRQVNVSISIRATIVSRLSYLSELIPNYELSRDRGLFSEPKNRRYNGYPSMSIRSIQTFSH